jgi:hypothetical protein
VQFCDEHGLYLSDKERLRVDEINFIKQDHNLRIILKHECKEYVLNLLISETELDKEKTDEVKTYDKYIDDGHG